MFPPETEGKIHQAAHYARRKERLDAKISMNPRMLSNLDPRPLNLDVRNELQCITFPAENTIILRNQPLN